MSNKIYQSFSLDDLPSLSSQILSDCNESRIFTFTGNLGAGKTTLIKNLCAELGFAGDVTSPTFSLVNEYSGTQHTIYHMDLYRLKNEEEALDIGLEEYLYSGHFCFIEWPLLAQNLLDEPYYAVKIEAVNNQARKIEITYIEKF